MKKGLVSCGLSLFVVFHLGARQHQGQTSDILYLKNNFDKALCQYQIEGKLDVSVLQSALILVDLELVIVNHMLDRRTGFIVEAAAMERDKQVYKSSSVAKAVYHQVMNLATFVYDDAVTRQAFLQYVNKTLDQYYSILESMQLSQPGLCPMPQRS